MREPDEIDESEHDYIIKLSNELGNNYAEMSRRIYREHSKKHSPNQLRYHITEKLKEDHQATVVQENLLDTNQCQANDEEPTTENQNNEVDFPAFGDSQLPEDTENPRFGNIFGIDVPTFQQDLEFPKREFSSEFDDSQLSEDTEDGAESEDEDGEFFDGDVFI